jgi:transposase
MRPTITPIDPAELESRISYATSNKEAKKLLFLWLWLFGNYSTQESLALLGVSESWIHRVKREYRERGKEILQKEEPLLSRAEGTTLLLRVLQKKLAPPSLKTLQQEYEAQVGQPVQRTLLKSFTEQFGLTLRALHKLAQGAAKSKLRP